MSSNLRSFTVLGLDPSLSNIGAVKLKLTLDMDDNCRVKGFTYLDMALSETSPDKKKTRKKNEEDRARAVEHKDFLKRMLQDVDFVFCELPTGSQSARAMASYGIAVGLSAWIEIPFFVVSPTELKLAACKNKQATKEDMVEWAMSQLPQGDWLWTKTKTALNKNEHMADALAAIVAGVKSDTFKKAMLFI